MNLEEKIIGEIKGDFTTINLRSIVGCISLLSLLIRHHFPTQNLLSDAKVREDVVERFL